MGITITKTLDKTALFKALTYKAAQQAITKAVFDAQAKAQDLVPVETGNLKNSIQGDLSAISELVGTVATDCEYAVYVEFGTVRSPAQPYFTPAVEDVGTSFGQVIAKLANSELEQL